MKYFNYKNYSAKRILELKKASGLTVGLALPVLNEAETLPSTINLIKKMGKIIDNFIIVDSGSTDGSRKICLDKKVRLVKAEQMAKVHKIPYCKGKGWNLWTSAYCLDTDIIVWIDSDIENIGNRFVFGLIGPLLEDRKLKFIKGYYKRPKNDSRVTEIMMRPFASLLRPELTDFIQPLSGEYGGRIEFLQNIKFYSGYSVEAATIIQATEKLHNNEIGQTYLGKRIHKLQSVASLGKMSASIMRTFLRLSKNTIKTSSEPKDFLCQFKQVGDNFRKISLRIKDEELPPVSTLSKNKL